MKRVQEEFDELVPARLCLRSLRLIRCWMLPV